MKKVLLIAAIAVFGLTSVNAQESNSETGQTAEGTILIEANTGFGAAHAANTGFALTSIDGETTWGLGLEGGYFIMDDLAIKAGLGYNDLGEDISAFSYKIGAKYYLLSQIPLQVDYSGASIKDVEENPSYLGLQAGYAFFLTENVSIEPGLRYNLSMNSDFYEDVLQFNIGFAIFL